MKLINNKAIILYCLCLLLCSIVFSPQPAKACHHSLDLVGAECGMCWVASIQYATSLYSFFPPSQEMISEYACIKWSAHLWHLSYPSQSPSCYLTCGYDCDCYDTWWLGFSKMAQIMDDMGFATKPNNFRTSPGELDESFCFGSNILYMPCLSGHVIVISGFDVYTNLVHVNDVLTTERWVSYASIVERGWNSTLKITAWSASTDFNDLVSIDEISSYSALQHSNTEVELQFQIVSSASPTDMAAVYITDNTLGPARLVETLVGTPDLEPSSNTWYDTLLTYSDNYYYFMDHGGACTDIRPIDELKEADYPSSSTNLEFAGSSNRPVFSSPGNFVAKDNPRDSGTAILLEWDLSQDDALIDCYNIYRAVSAISKLEYFTSVEPGDSTFVDTTVIPGIEYWYLISAAHHGDIENAPTGSFAIWNDFNPYVQGPVDFIDNLANTISVPTSDYNTLTLCPEGDADTIRVVVEVLGEDTTAVEGLDNELIELVLFDSADIGLCSSNPIYAIDDTDEDGITEIAYPFVGGCDSIYIQASVDGRISDNFLIIYCKSPDFDGDGDVDLSDAGILGVSHNTSKGDSLYCDCADLTWDEHCNLSDFAILGEHYQDVCPVSSSRSTNYYSAESGIDVEIVFGEVASDNSIEVKVFANNADDITHMAFALNNDMSDMIYDYWIPNSCLDKATVGVPVVNKDRELLMFFVFGDETLGSDRVELGTIKYNMQDNNHLAMATNATGMDMKLVFGDALDDNDNLVSISGTMVIGGSESMPKLDYLGRNYPNPFNPSTTIEYGIAANSHVSLKIYNINGQLVKTLVNEERMIGHYKEVWDGLNNRDQRVASGVYFYKMKTSKYTKTKKMVLLR